MIAVSFKCRCQILRRVNKGRETQKDTGVGASERVLRAACVLGERHLQQSADIERRERWLFVIEAAVCVCEHVSVHAVKQSDGFIQSTAAGCCW